MFEKGYEDSGVGFKKCSSMPHKILTIQNLIAFQGIDVKSCFDTRYLIPDTLESSQNVRNKAMVF